MKAHSARYQPLKAAVICRAALKRGVLKQVPAGPFIGWQFGRRIFTSMTVNRLIVAGVAVRDGDIVRAA